MQFPLAVNPQYQHQVLTSSATGFASINPAVRHPPLSVVQRMQAAFQMGAGQTVRETAIRFQTTKTTMGRMRQLATGNLQPHDLTRDQHILQYKKHFVAYSFLSHPSWSAQAVADGAKALGLTISRSSVNRLALEMGFKAQMTQKREKLTPLQKLSRKAWAFRIKTSGLFRMNWVFSDESMLVLNPVKRRVRVIRGYEVPEKYQEYAGYPTKVMVWGAIGPGYKSPLIRLDGTLTAAGYQKMLHDHRIFQGLNQRYGLRGYIFQQDGARPHTAAATKEWLAGQDVNTLEGQCQWPASSPDLSVIENCWWQVKYNIDYTKVTDADSLFAEAERVWNEIPIPTINNMIADFLPRLNAVFATEGECLNMYKSILKKFREDEAAGVAEWQRIVQQKGSVHSFCENSRLFFQNLDQLPMEWRFPDMNPSECKSTYTMSCMICEFLPAELKQRAGLPVSYTRKTVPVVPMHW